MCAKERNRIATSNLERERLKAGYGEYEANDRDRVVSASSFNPSKIPDLLFESNTAAHGYPYSFRMHLVVLAFAVDSYPGVGVMLSLGKSLLTRMLWIDPRHAEEHQARSSGAVVCLGRGPATVQGGIPTSGGRVNGKWRAHHMTGLFQ